MPLAQRIRLGGAAAVLGGVLWVVLRPLVSTTWDSAAFGLTYGDYNRLMVTPLALLLAGTWSLHARFTPTIGRLGGWGLGLLALGVALSLAGVVIEFWWGRGLSGDRDLAMAGWGFYLVGLLGQAIGLALFGIAARRARARPPWLGTVSLLMAALHILWPPSIGLETVRALPRVDLVRPGPGPRRPRVDRAGVRGLAGPGGAACRRRRAGRGVRRTRKGSEVIAMTTIAFGRWAGPAAVLGGLLWMPFGVFVMLRPWGPASIYFEDLGYGLITDSLLFRAYILPGGLALLLSAVGLLGVFARLGPTAGRARTSGRLLACVALALAALSLAGVVALFEPISAVGNALGSLALGAATFLAGLHARRLGAARGWTRGLLALGVVGLLLLPLWPLVYAVELVPPAAGAAYIALFGLGWVALGYALWSERGKQLVGRHGASSSEAREASR